MHIAWIKLFNARAVAYMVANLGGKSLAALSQLYAIYVFTRIHTADEAALIFLLLGYAIWFQVFEFGLSQTLQNKFNARQASADEMLTVTIGHYLCMLVVAGFVFATPFLANVLLPPRRSELGDAGVKAFSTGAAIMLLATNNVINQRLLLVFNKGQLGNVLIMLQSALAIIGLAIYDYFERENLVGAVILYLGPQVLVFLPLMLGWTIRLLRRSSELKFERLCQIMYDSIGFWGLGVLAAIFLGADYYFAAHHLNSEQVVSYHLATRLFFISFVAYYAYLQHSAKRLSELSLSGGMDKVGSIIKYSASIGFAMVFAVYLVIAALEGFGFFQSMTHGTGIGQGMLFSAFLYFMIRVCRDVGVVVAIGLNERNIVYKVYLLEILVGLSLMYFLVPNYGGQGLFIGLTVACCVGFALLAQHARKMGTSFRFAKKR